MPQQGPSKRPDFKPPTSSICCERHTASTAAFQSCVRSTICCCGVYAAKSRRIVRFSSQSQQWHCCLPAAVHLVVAAVGYESPGVRWVCASSASRCGRRHAQRPGATANTTNAVPTTRLIARGLAVPSWWRHATLSSLEGYSVVSRVSSVGSREPSSQSNAHGYLVADWALRHAPHAQVVRNPMHPLRTAPAIRYQQCHGGGV